MSSDDGRMRTPVDSSRRLSSRHCLSTPRHSEKVRRDGGPGGAGTAATVLLLTNEVPAAAEILPALELLPHLVVVAQAEATGLLDAPPYDMILLDARHDLVKARSLCRLMTTIGKESPMLLVVSEDGLAALSADWAFDDFLLNTASAAETDARIRLQASPSARIVSASTRRPAEPLITTASNPAHPIPHPS